MKLLPDPGGIASPGFYDLTDDRYHADPVVQPSLSSSLAAMLLDKSPRHAWAEHPRLGGALEQDEDEDKLPTRPMEVGSVVHSLLLGKGATVDVIDAPTYQSKAAKEARAASYGANRQPILACDMKKVERIVAAAREQIAAEPEIADMFDGGVPEAVMVWKDEAGPWCRAMLDLAHVANQGALIIDIKTSATSVNPNGSALGWKIADMGYETRAAFYERGLVSLRPDLAGRVTFRHVWLEVEPPYSLVVSELDGASRDLGRKKAAAAIGIWQRCLSAGTDAQHWPRYGAGIHRIEYPQRAESEWLEREMNDAAVQEALAADPFLGFGRLNPMPSRSREHLDSIMGG